MWRTPSINTRCLLWVVSLPRSVPKQIQWRERNMLYLYCGRVSNDTKYEPQVWSGWQKLYMWQNFLCDQSSNEVNFYVYFHSHVSIWFLKDWHYFHIEELCHFYCHFQFSTYWYYSSCPKHGLSRHRLVIIHTRKLRYVIIYPYLIYPLFQSWFSISHQCNAATEAGTSILKL